MRIEVKLFSILKDYLPNGSESSSCWMEIDDNTRVQDILFWLKIPDEIPKIVLVNKVHAKKDELLKEGDVLSIFPPVAGG